MEERYKYDNTKVHALSSATATAELFPSEAGMSVRLVKDNL